MHYYSGIAKQLLFVFLLGILISACSKKNQAEKPESVNERTPLYIIKNGGFNPFYFELGVDGPALIPSPKEAALNPLIPWTHSRLIVDFLPLSTDGEDRGEILYAAVNRGGILEFKSSAALLRSGSIGQGGSFGEIAVCYYQGEENRENLLLSALFSYNQKPAVLFTKERFFSVEEQASVSSSVWAVSGLFLEKTAVPALNAEDTVIWETSNVFFGRDGNWYFRRINPKGESAYFCTADLSQKGKEINAELYLEVSSPLEVNSPSVPKLLAWVIDEASRLSGSPCIASVVSAEFPAKRFFCSKGAISGDSKNSEDSRELSGYYRPPALGKEELAVILFPDGRGVYARSAGSDIKDGHFALPALPSGESGSFFYTGAALLGESPELYLIASWEEQENWNVGASGFLLLEIDW